MCINNDRSILFVYYYNYQSRTKMILIRKNELHQNIVCHKYFPA
jgi:hypothetical protein